MAKVTSINKDKAIDIIVERLKSAEDKQVTFAFFGKKWQTPQDTFNKWYIIAKKKHAEQSETVQKKVLEQTVDQEVKAHQEALMNRKKRLETLHRKFDEISSIKRGKVVLTDKKTGDKIGEMKVSIYDELKAIETMCKLDERISKAEGTDAASKQEVRNTDKDGNDIKSSFVVLTMTEAEAQKKLDALS